MRCFRRNRCGQVTVETAVLFGFVVAGLVAMSVYLQRGVQGGMKSNADSFGTQFSANSGWSNTTTSHTEEDDSELTQTQDVEYEQELE